MCKSSLELHELLYGKLLLRLIGKSVFSVYNLIYRPYAGIYRSLADRDEILCRIIPASGAGSKNVDKCGALGIDSAVCLLMEILHISEESCLSSIVYSMCDNDLCKILLILLLAYRFCARRCGGRCSEPGSCRRSLGSGIHICIIVIAEIGKIMSSFKCTGK